MIFTGECNGYAVSVSYWDNHVKFRCEAMTKDFNSLAELERAVNSYDLALRKQFSNRTAYMKPSWRMNANGKPEQVEITSVTDKDAWIKRVGKREKVQRDELFADRDALTLVIEYEQQQHEQIKQQWESLKRWEPQP